MGDCAFAFGGHLLFSKYNSYGDGLNKIAILDPNATQFDAPIPGIKQMREILVALGCTSNGGLLPVREWCINAGAVNPATASVFASSEDGRIYRWNLAANSLDESLPLAQAIGEPYVPASVGPDGGVY